MASKITRSSGNVFADLGLPNPEERMLKARIASAISKAVKRHALTQVVAAERMGIAQADVSKILNGRLSGYSLERLLSLVQSLGNDVEIKVKPTKNERGRMLVSA
jgi:predicted XRE-type DNA-binding protein